nr:VanW family protein [Fulvivirga marina]
MVIWKIDGNIYAKYKQTEKLPYRVKKHQSKLIRKLGDADMKLQYNKVDNLKLVVKGLNGLIIKPGETFSFYKIIGRPTKRKGFKEGIELSFGKARAGIGGGICQSTNLLHWLALHSPLTITERHHHSIDPFPDDGRVLPWASGSAIFYNYLDFQLTNNTEWTFQMNLWLTEKTIDGEIRVNEELDFAYHVFETDHQFLEKGNQYFRTNKIWRNKIAKFKSGKVLETELMYENYGKVLYTPTEDQLKR